MLIRCNKCGKTFESTEDFAALVEYDLNGKTICEMYDPSKSYSEPYEVFEGCPNCVTDKYLMDIEED